jgi:hypothetical protein
MITKLVSAGLILFSAVAYASNLSVDFQAKDLSLKGTFTFKPGSPLTITSNDDAGKPFELEIKTTIQKEDIVQFIYHLKRNDKTESGSVITRKNELAKLATGPQGQNPTTRFEAKWSEQ